MRVESSVPDLAMKNKYVFLIVSHCHTKKGVLATLGQSLKGGAITCNSREKKKRDLKEKVKIKGKTTHPFVILILCAVLGVVIYGVLPMVA